MRFRKLDRLISTSNEEKLEGTVEPDLWETKTAERKRELNAPKQADTAYLVEGVRLVDLANRAGEKCRSMRDDEKREMVNPVLSKPQVIRKSALCLQSTVRHVCANRRYVPFPRDRQHFIPETWVTLFPERREKVRMPWKECQEVEERLRFIARLLDGEKVVGLCREFGISRTAGYNIYQHLQTEVDTKRIQVI